MDNGNMRGHEAGGLKKKITGAVGTILIFMLFVIYMVPFILIVLNSFKAKTDIIKNPFSLIAKKGYSFANYVKAFSKMNFVRAFGNSLFVTGLATLAVIVFASMTAYYFVRAKNNFSKLFFALMAVSMIIPFQAIK